jgi:GT2 family glycosyltransferase
MPHRRIDLIVPIYKNAELVKACVDSLIRHLPEIAESRPRLVLVNDSPDDADVAQLLQAYSTAATAATAAPELMVLRNDTNLGFVRSVNRGIAQAVADGHDVLLINSDTQTFAGTLANLLAAARADPQIGFASPRSNNASICSLPHFFGGPAPAPEEAYERWHVLSRTMPAYHFTPTAVGFYMFVSHTVLADHGGLREDFGLGYEEENDLVMRAGKVGTRAVLANHAFAYHAGSASFNLTDLDLADHRHQNLQKLAGFHPEFLPLVRRYEASPHFRAERLMTGLLPDAQGRLKVVFDLTGMGEHHNGTNEQTVAVLRAMAAGHADRIRLAGVATAESFKFHGLDLIDGLHREEPDAPGLHGVAIRMAQPFDLHHINVLEALAPINVFAMLDTIAEDCGPLAAENDVGALWDHVAQHANGLIFTSRFTEQTFCNRHPAANALPRWQQLLPTRLACYAKPRRASKRSHVLVLGNHYPHKGSDEAAAAIAAALPDTRVVALGSETKQTGNLTSHRAGLLAPDMVEQLFTDAAVVVLPSYVEGFGFGFMHALAAGRPIVARRIPATEEIMATLDEVEGVFLFDNNSQLLRACREALESSASKARDSRTHGWDHWADGVAAFASRLAARANVYACLAGRVSGNDFLRKAALANTNSSATELSNHLERPNSATAVDLPTLLKMDGEDFVTHAYATILRRPADKGGVRTYCDELARGTSKLEVLRTLTQSPEGRSANATSTGIELITTQPTAKSTKPSIWRKIYPIYRRKY